MQRKKRKNIGKKRKSRLFFYFCILLIIFGCGQEQSNQPIKIVVKKRTHRLKLNKSVQQTKSIKLIGKKFIYDPLAIKRNPFKPFIKEKPIEIPLQPKELVVTPLTEYSLDQYKLVGIMTDTRPPLAMVQTSDKKGLIFTIGDYIGSEYYKVVKIYKNIVVLQKKFLTNKKKIKIEQKILKIDLSGE